MNDKDYKTTGLQDYKLRLLAFVISLLSLAFVVSSCSTKRDLGRNNLKSLSANHLIREIEDNQFEFENIEAKIGLSLKGDSSFGLKGQIRMQKDSVIWISLSLKVGIEVGRIMITNDSIKFINRSTKTYLSESIEHFKNKLPIEASLQLIQNLLIGNDIYLRKADRSRVTIDNDRYNLELTTKEDDIVKNVIVTPQTFKISECNIKEINNEQSLRIRYDEFNDVNGKLVPSKIILENSKFNVEINYSDIKVGEKLEFPFNISPKFEQILIW